MKCSDLLTIAAVHMHKQTDFIWRLIASYFSLLQVKDLAFNYLSFFKKLVLYVFMFSALFNFYLLLHWDVFEQEFSIINL